MRNAGRGIVIVAGLVLAVVGTGLLLSSAFAQRPLVNSADRGIASGELITLAAPAGDGRQQLVVIDPRMRVMSVYQIDLATGQVALKSVRNIHWDLQMDEFNGASPSPREIRSLLPQK
jgi:hypothetical protein